METFAEAVLFDLDGVIVRTDRLHFAAWKRLCDSKGWRFDEDLNHRLRGVSRMESLETILSHNGVELPDSEKASLAEAKNRNYRDLIGSLSKADLVPGAVELVRNLRTLNVKTAVCSASRNAPDVVGVLDIGALFDAVLSGLDVKRAKPDPEIFLAAASRLGVLPGRCVVVEDAASGVQAALAAGMRCVGLGTHAGLAKAHLILSSLEGVDAASIVNLPAS